MKYYGLYWLEFSYYSSITQITISIESQNISYFPSLLRSEIMEDIIITTYKEID